METKFEKIYEAPLVEILLVEIERGFGGSGLYEDGTGTPGLDEGEIFD